MTARDRSDTSGPGETPRTEQTDTAQTDTESINTVHLRGRVAAPGTERVLPSGDVIVTARLVVRRPVGSVRPRQPVDTLDCVAWGGHARRALLAWPAGSMVEVQGAVRRRFWRGPGGPTSRVEIEVTRARMLRRSRVSTTQRS